MGPTILIVLSALVFGCVVFTVDALVTLMRTPTGGGDRDEEIRTELSSTVDVFTGSEARRRRRGRVLEAVERLILQANTGLTMARAAWIVGIIAAAIIGGLLFFVGGFLLFLLIPLAILAGALPVFLYLMRARAKRLGQFQEQLPDAIDLIVRSLKVGHPLTSAIGVIGREMPDPVGKEFSIAAEQATYGKSVPETLVEMQERVPVSDLGYLTVAVQIQEETGGNLVESLAKLSRVIRERFRMFRKAKAITAEGRISAWLLSFFPFGIGGAVLLVKPDYYSQVVDYPLFEPLAITTVVMLAVNIVAMRILSTLKV